MLTHTVISVYFWFMTHAVDSTAHEELDLPAPADYRADAAADRARQINTIRALADWLSSHPEVPIPQLITCTAILHAGAGRPLERRLDEIAAFAVAHDAYRIQSESTVWASKRLTESAALTIDYNLSTPLPVPL